MQKKDPIPLVIKKSTICNKGTIDLDLDDDIASTRVSLVLNHNHHPR